MKTVKGDPEEVLLAAKLLHHIIQFTIKTPNTSGELAFLIAQTSSVTIGMGDQQFLRAMSLK